MKLLPQLYLRPVAGMSRILDEGRLLLALLLALATSFLLHYCLPPVPEEFESGLWALVPSNGFTLVATLALVFVPASILLVNLWDSLGGAGVILRRDYLPALVCSAMAWTAAFLPVGLLCAAARFARQPLPLRALLALLALGGVYFLFLHGCALRVVMGTATPRALVVSVVSVAAALGGLYVSGFTGGSLYYLASPFFLYYAYSFFATDIRLIGTGLRSRQSFRRHLEASAINPRDADAHYQLGLIYQQRRQNDEAAARFRKAFEIDPEEADAHFQYGRIAREKGNYAEALASLQRAAALDDKHASSEVWRETGAVHFQSGRFPEALAALEKYVDRRPYDPEGLYWYGRTLRQLDRNDDARDAFRRAIEAAKTMPPYRAGQVRAWSNRSAAELKTLKAG